MLIHLWRNSSHSLLIESRQVGKGFTREISLTPLSFGLNGSVREWPYVPFREIELMAVEALLTWVLGDRNDRNQTHLTSGWVGSRLDEGWREAKKLIRVQLEDAVQDYGRNGFPWHLLYYPLCLLILLGFYKIFFQPLNRVRDSSSSSTTPASALPTPPPRHNNNRVTYKSDSVCDANFYENNDTMTSLARGCHCHHHRSSGNSSRSSSNCRCGNHDGSSKFVKGTMINGGSECVKGAMIT
ncbi:hypothetical protein SK128_002536 [Halocaridina rubra]|uniref:Uncharacterized protein n=1 Tax=Halocaridina rubra TaxID=373956 RepID=A0AAN9A5V3_HALRR